MRAKQYILLYLIALCVYGVAAAWQSTPGYMDADYYYAGGLRIANNYDFSEPFLWNYLGEPIRIPQPSHTYWMPLTSVVSAISILIFPGEGFNSARLIFILFAAFLPPLTAYVSFLLAANREKAIFAGFLAVFPGFYLPFLTTTDAFVVYMLTGSVFLSVANKAFKQDSQGIHFRTSVVLGFLAGILHLTRADGALWLLVGFVAIMWIRKRSSGTTNRFIFTGVTALFILTATYLIVMSPWFIRNIRVFGSLFPPGGSRTLWLVTYDDLFAFPASLITPTRWLEQGLWQIFLARLSAAWTNLQTALAVQGSVFLAPLIVAGGWRYRKHPLIKLGLSTWLSLFVTMTVLFPQIGARGGFFHAGAALQPLMWALAPAGLAEFIGWGVTKRNWKPSQAFAVFRTGLILLAVMLSGLIFVQRVIGDDSSRPQWNRSYQHYRSLETALIDIGAGEGEIVMVNNPPGYYLAATRPAIPVPGGGESALLSAAIKYGAAYVLLEENYLGSAVNNLYQEPGDRPGLEYLGTEENTRIYRVEQ